MSFFRDLFVNVGAVALMLFAAWAAFCVVQILRSLVGVKDKPDGN